ncbi:hypothetical protein GCM10023194_08350 [Planotetraspora phitsanulokensis]|uniref:Peptidase M15B domain-containing protein n=1 Tax=Planotetraspora phitsanulokensis TaxID=575192 RepID=A0A8J3XGD6_9ACTN|nr:hypothetical protein [Planotetraspora phitsanulokensis]GII39979.1 hypothetical protein Pph01_49820 [Planotetraspora phitsanulokensis]
MGIHPSWSVLAGAACVFALLLLAQPSLASTPAPAPVVLAAAAPQATAEAPQPPSLPRGVDPPSESLVGTFTATIQTWDASATAVRMDQAEAMHDLLAAGLGWKSSGHCVDADRRTCTSLEDIRYGTLMQAIDLKYASGCPITVTGGTEKGHAGGRFSHGHGFKVDIAHNACVDSYITRTYRFWKVRGDGADLFRPPPMPGSRPALDVYADEPTHWDILFR